MEAAVGSGYRVVADLSLELALPPPLRTEGGQRGDAAWASLFRWREPELGRGPPAAHLSHPREVLEGVREAARSPFLVLAIKHAPPTTSTHPTPAGARTHPGLSPATREEGWPWVTARFAFWPCDSGQFLSPST